MGQHDGQHHAGLPGGLQGQVAPRKGFLRSFIDLDARQAAQDDIAQPCRSLMHGCIDAPACPLALWPASGISTKTLDGLSTSVHWLLPALESAMNDVQSELEHAEEMLRAAMLAADVETLDALIEEDLLFVGPTGRLLSKELDLGLYRSGEQRMSAIDLRERHFRIGEQAAAVSSLAFVVGNFKGQGFQGHFRYLRLWHRSSTGWKLVAGSVSQVGR
jgi:hypothetical protein